MIFDSNQPLAQQLFDDRQKQTHCGLGQNGTSLQRHIQAKSSSASRSNPRHEEH